MAPFFAEVVVGACVAWSTEVVDVEEESDRVSVADVDRNRLSRRAIERELHRSRVVIVRSAFKCKNPQLSPSLPGSARTGLSIAKYGMLRVALQRSTRAYGGVFNVILDADFWWRFLGMMPPDRSSLKRSLP
jgi:hypothetical protein